MACISFNTCIKKQQVRKKTQLAHLQKMFLIEQFSQQNPFFFKKQHYHV
jgi:hypothetical protein